MKRKKRCAITLIEIMIVIMLIGLIGGALAYNMRGSMEKGRAFKTEQTKEKLYDILMLEYSRGEYQLREIIQTETLQLIVSSSPLVKQGADLMKDGWGADFSISIKGDDIDIRSSKLDAYKKKHEVKKK